MKRLLTIATITALTSAFAAEVTWNGDGAYALGAGDTMKFSENATITAKSAFTGSGTIIVSDGTLTLNYKISETPFSGFTGAIRIDGGATVDENSSQEFAEDGTYSTSVFGPSATIIFNGGTLRGFKGQNNSQITGPVEVRSDSTILNDRSSSGSGVNLRFRSTVSFTGDKTLTINSNYRWVEFANGVDFSAFTGGIVLNGNSTQEAALYGTNYGESASWTFNANRDFRIAPGTGNTVKFGAIDAQNGRIKLDGNNVTVEVGSKTDSAISVPFTNKAFTLKKVGAGTSLVLSSEATLLDGSSINVAEGTLEIDGQDLSAITVTFAADSTLKLDSTSKATIGTAFGKLDFASGAKLSFSASGLASGKHTLFTYNNENPIASVSDVVEVTGISANASVQISDDNGTVKATIDIPTLVWNGEQTNWTDANAWTVGETKCTFCEGDKVSFTNESSVFLSSEVSLGGMAIAESATVTITGSNGAKITANSLVNNGSLIIIGDVVLDSQITGSVLVSANSTLTFVSGQSIENLKFTGTGTVKFNTADTMDCTYANLYSNGVFTNFEGILELTGGAKIKNTSGLNDNGKVFFPAGMTLRLNGGSVTESAESVNVTVNANIEILGGGDFSYNSIFTKAANFNMTGKITGSGKATFESGKRGFHISGDNSDFTGSLRIKASRGGSNGYGAGFNGSLSGGSKAAWTLSGTEHESRDGSIRTFYIKGITSADAPICFGALNVPDASCYVQLQNDPCYMTVGSDECAEDSTIEGRFIYKKVSLVKQGQTTLTLGKGFEIVDGTSSSSLSRVDGSTVRVDAGTLAVNATNLNAAVTVESGATLAGTGTVYSVVFNAGAKVGFDGLTDTPEPGDIVEGIVVGSLDGATPAIANAPVCTKGKWKLRTKSVEAGTQFYAEFVKRGFCVIVQ